MVLILLIYRVYTVQPSSIPLQKLSYDTLITVFICDSYLRNSDFTCVFLVHHLSIKPNFIRLILICFNIFYI